MNLGAPIRGGLSEARGDLLRSAHGLRRGLRVPRNGYEIFDRNASRVTTVPGLSTGSRGQLAVRARYSQRQDLVRPAPTGLPFG